MACVGCGVLMGLNTYLSSVHALKCTEASLAAPEITESGSLNEHVHKFWDIETIGIREDESSVYEDFLNTIKYDEVKYHYEVKLPWKSDHGHLPDNFSNAARRLNSQFKRLKQKPEILKQYHQTILDQLNDNIIEV